jgi:hypothetical protein
MEEMEGMMLEQKTPSKRGRKPSPKFGELGVKATISINTPNLDFLRELSAKQNTHYSWVLDDILTALRTGDQNLLDRALNPSG